jgi:hypothetical protein
MGVAVVPDPRPGPLGVAGHLHGATVPDPWVSEAQSRLGAGAALRPQPMAVAVGVLPRHYLPAVAAAVR